MARFDDMLIGYRGVGTIGTFLAGFVLVSLLLLSVLVLDPRLNGAMESTAGFVARQEREISQLTRELSSAEAKYDQYLQRKKLEEAVAAHLQQEASAKTRSKELSVRIEQHAEELRDVRARHAKYAQAYREHLRDKAVGEILPTLTTPDGRVLESPQIVKVTPAGLQLRYQDGIVRVPVKDLPRSICERFQFGETEMELFLEAERQKVGELERGIDRGLAEIQDVTRRKRLVHLDERIPFLRDRIKSCTKQVQRMLRSRSADHRVIDQLKQRIETDRKELLSAESEIARLRTGGHVTGRD